jgi:hypothetical protein
MWVTSSCQRLQSRLAATKTLLQLHRILNAARQLLIAGRCHSDPPVVLISQFAGLAFEQQEARSDELLKSALSGANSVFAHTAQAVATSSLVRQLAAVQPSKDPALQQHISNFLDAVQRVSEVFEKPLQDKSLKWSTRPKARGCGLDCSQSHSGDGNCLVCGLGWSPHNGHTCSRAPFAGRRGSWVSSLGVAPVVTAHVETSPGSVKFSLYPKSSEFEGIQSENSLESNSDREVGTVVTFNIVHSSTTSTPKVIVGLTLTPPPLVPPIAAKVSLGIDLGNLKIIDNVSSGSKSVMNFANQLKLAMSMSPTVVK